jgi:hypothetical protein
LILEFIPILYDLIWDIEYEFLLNLPENPVLQALCRHPALGNRAGFFTDIHQMPPPADEVFMSCLLERQ